jgi:hypothetical protein
MNSALKLFVLMFIQFLVLTLNTASIAKHYYLGTFLTDLVICLLGFTILKQIAEADTMHDRIAYALGGAIGAQAGIFLSGWIR